MSYVGTTYVGDRIPAVRALNVYVGNINLTFTPNSTINKQYIIAGSTTSVFTPNSSYYENHIISGDVSLIVTPNSTVIREKILTTVINLALESSPKGRIDWATVERLTNMLTNMLTDKIPRDWREILDG